MSPLRLLPYSFQTRADFIAAVDPIGIMSLPLQKVHDVGHKKVTPAWPMVRLRLIATSDLHAHILPWDELTNTAAPDRGLAQVASLIGAARAEVAASLLLDNGDFLNGSPLADHLAETGLRRRGPAHPMIAAMNALGYDAATLGNHEFSHGLDHLKAALGQARFPVINSNLDSIGKGGARPFVPRFAMIKRCLTDDDGQSHDLTIGIMGLLPPQTVLWERRHLQGKVTARDILSSARRAEHRLRRLGADLVVVLAHSGLGRTAAQQDLADDENMSAALAMMPGIDAVIAGHTHQVFPATREDGPLGARAPLVMPGCFGSHLGVIDLAVQHGPSGWHVVNHSAEVRAVAQRVGPAGDITVLAASDPAIAVLAQADTEAMRRAAETTTGQTFVPLHSHFALIGHSAIQTLLARAQLSHMRGLLHGRPEAALPLLTSVAPFKAGGRGGPANFTDIAPGALTARHISDLYMHPNSAVALRVTGQDIALWLERAVSLFHQVTQGAQDAPLINLAFPAFNFDIIQGVQFQIDLTQPARFDANGAEVAPTARRICHLCFEGQPILSQAEFVLATNSYRASGGAGFAGTQPARLVLEDSRPLRQVLQDYVTCTGRVSPSARPDWGFVPMPGTTVVFDSGQGGAGHCAEVPGLTALGMQSTGFMRFRLAL